MPPMARPRVIVRSAPVARSSGRRRRHRLARRAQHPRRVGGRQVAPAGVGDQPGHGLVPAALDALDGEDHPGRAQLRGQAALRCSAAAWRPPARRTRCPCRRLDVEPDVGPGVRRRGPPCAARSPCPGRPHRPAGPPGSAVIGEHSQAKAGWGLLAAPSRPSTTAATRASSRGASLTWPVSVAGGRKTRSPVAARGCVGSTSLDPGEEEGTSLMRSHGAGTLRAEQPEPPSRWPGGWPAAGTTAGWRSWICGMRRESSRSSSGTRCWPRPGPTTCATSTASRSPARCAATGGQRQPRPAHRRDRGGRAALEVLNPSAPLPFPIDERVTVGEEARLKYRYLDLRRPAPAAAIRLRSEVNRVARNAARRARTSSRSRRRP